jgi:hypothetical protein
VCRQSSYGLISDFPTYMSPGGRQDEKAGHKGQQIIQQPKLLHRVATELLDVWAIAHQKKPYSFSSSLKF